MEKSNIIDVLKERIDVLENWKKGSESPEKKKTNLKPKPTVDEEVCSMCGGNLEFVKEGIVYCPKCDQYFEYEEDGE